MKKTYRGFIIWMVVWLLLMCTLPFIAQEAAMGMRLICNLMTLGIAVLAHMICRNECVYWYTGLTFEEAEAAGSERRVAYAKAMRKPFVIIAAGLLVLSVAGHALGWSMWIDFVVATVGTIAAAFSTIRVKL